MSSGKRTKERERKRVEGQSGAALACPTPTTSIPAPTPSPSAQAMYLQKLQESSEAIKAGNFRRAIQLYTESIGLDSENHILYTNRAAAHLKNSQPEKALEDAVRARSICPKWGKVCRPYNFPGVPLCHSNGKKYLSGSINILLLNSLVSTSPTPDSTIQFEANLPPKYLGSLNATLFLL
ncbi:stress-induced-phosphoprotein 1 [Elysia marginata]|uniref:Stress-induced-phosphoprotein 1 n=1 Tax=Elysia marginata TaxID=1093978 RepID=A0AAV4HGM5_9GAST|nr:stress-induced-phosphoprotein 1 [Elysia marginata]